MPEFLNVILPVPYGVLVISNAYGLSQIVGTLNSFLYLFRSTCVSHLCIPPFRGELNLPVNHLRVRQKGVMTANKARRQPSGIILISRIILDVVREP